MKRVYFTFLLLIIGMLAQAQNIAVKSFRALPMDMTASSLEGKRIDQNNEVAALIKIVTTQTGFTFEAGALGIVDTWQEVGEVWVWVPRGSRKITIKHPQLGILRDYRYPIEIQAERTYEMQLVTGTVETIVKEQIHEQYLMFQIDPPGAILEVDDQMWPLSPSGSASKFVNFGTYSYRVQAPNYHPDAGKVTVNDPNNTVQRTISLKPNFGWIEVSGGEQLQGAAVYVDNAIIGKVPCKSGQLKSGQHNVRIVKELYEPYTSVVTVSDNETTMVSPSLTADFAHITLQVEADAEIWVNDERKGTRSWSGNLPTGVYKIECKRNNHESSLTTKEITNQMDGETIVLSAPKPIYGSLMVESEPAIATIYIDGQEIGQTPKIINEILIGSHELRLSKKDYADYSETINITKGERKQVKATLSSGKEIQFTCNVPNAQLEIDGQRVGTAAGTYQLTYGSHSLRVTAADYQDYTTTFSVTESSSRSYSIQLKSVTKDEEIFTVNGVSFTMKLVEGGTFQMGAQKTDSRGQNYDNDAYDDESPVHSVTLSSYYMGETEVTQALWQAVMGSNPSRFKGDNLPVEQVSWNDIQEFIRKLNQKTGKNFRLPTEAEWEYAARGGKKSNGYKYAGSNDIGSVAWYTGTTNDSGTKTVKTKTPNELGLYDMSGNVWEWCQDWYGSDYYGKSPSTNPAGPSSGSYRVLRGGSWYYIAWDCRVSFRDNGDPDYRSDFNGFRLCLPQ